MRSIFNSLGGSSSAANISIELDGMDTREKLSMKEVNGGEYDMIPLYSQVEGIKGTVRISPTTPGKSVEHQGIRIEFLGVLCLYTESGSLPRDKVRFQQLYKELRSSGSLFQNETHPFEFNVERANETFRGKAIAIRYVLRVTMSMAYSSIVKEQDIAVHGEATPWSDQSLGLPSPSSLSVGDGDCENDGEVVKAPRDSPEEGIRMEVGIEDCLHIEFEFDKNKYHLRDVILGKVHFRLVRIKIKYMELNILRREKASLDGNKYDKQDNIIKFELMDGAPIKGESVPVRLFLAPLDLTPSYKTIADCASIKYYLNLVLIDEEDRRYYKQHEISFYR